jgi:GNAT superfamily N-acetyltransferase
MEEPPSQRCSRDSGLASCQGSRVPITRQLLDGDISACSRLLHALPHWFGDREANARYLEALSSAPAFVARNGEAIVGFLALKAHTPLSVEILVMAVDPSSQGEGFGRDLIATAERWCTERHVHWLHVKTRGPSTYDDPYERTRGFYRAMGFEDLYESLTEWGPADAALVLVKAMVRNPA